MAQRGEGFLSSAHGRDVVSQAEMALDAQGRILALRLHSQANVGAYATPTGVAIQLMIGPWVQTSVYDIPVIDSTLPGRADEHCVHWRLRGAGRPEAIYLMERLIDEAARQTGIDRLSLRRRNFIRPEQMPYTNAMGQQYDSGRFERVMDQAPCRWPTGRVLPRAPPAQARGLWRGPGIANLLNGPAATPSEERVTVTIQADGVVEVFSAVNAMGQVLPVAGAAGGGRRHPGSNRCAVLGDTDRGDGSAARWVTPLFTGGSAGALAPSAP